MSEDEIKVELEKLGYSVARNYNEWGKWMVVRRGDESGSNSPLYFNSLEKALKESTNE